MIKNIIIDEQPDQGLASITNERTREQNFLCIGGRGGSANYCSDDPVYLKFEAEWEEDDYTVNCTQYVRRNSAGGIYLDCRFSILDDDNRGKRDYYLVLPISVTDMYDILQDQESIWRDGRSAKFYVHYFDHEGQWTHADHLPDLDTFMQAREQPGASAIGTMSGASPAKTNVLVELFNNEPDSKGVHNWFYYNRNAYTDETL